MEDFRTEFYNRYVSKFKDHLRGDASYALSRKMTGWYDSKYFPHIKNFPKDSSILDIGCGNGIIMEYLRQKGFTNIKGFDISAEQVEIAKSKNLEAEVADIFDFLEGSTKSYDIIFALDFVEHFRKEELLRIFELISKNLSDGGILIIHTPNGEGLMPNRVIWGDITHCTIFTPSSLSQILRLTGFERFEFSESGPVAKNVIGAVRVVLWGIIKLSANFVRRVERNLPQKIWTQDFICVASKH